ncbi:hypothetical protein DL240_16280 [Lujinxingia litoralis]|uniref:Uncharacterized protein n=1 Tax=Lujinxingia litoralis TaxID=2211119 RepID=A0A328C2V6_9DELT|nr:hypothetical protein [Lujinxingia litoralis]RAL20590.1 hypothetical protein DL240_16280 [Lujinxingia litoralis]
MFGALNQFRHEFKDLMARRTTGGILRRQLLAAFATTRRDMLLNLVDLLLGQQLAAMALMPRLSTWRAAGRLSTRPPLACSFVVSGGRL